VIVDLLGSIIHDLLGSSRQAKLLGEMWRALSLEEKQAFRDDAAV
jgi:hypothetical protein